MIAAMAEGASQITNFGSGNDCAATLSCLRQLGVSIDVNEQRVRVQGLGLQGFRTPAAPLDCGNSGTTMRLLAGILAGQSFTSELAGDASLSARPMQRIIEPLEMMGAEISSSDGRAPLRIRGRQPLSPISYELLVPSAQVKSCILLAGLNADGRTEVVEDEPTRDHTERMLRFFKVRSAAGQAERENARFAAIYGRASFSGRDLAVPGDISSASYFVAAAALIRGSSIQIDDVGVNPTRVAFLNQLRSLGFEVSISETVEVCHEPVGVVRVTRMADPKPAEPFQRPFLLDGLMIPRLIDELPLIAVVGSQLDGGLEIRDAAELRVKESDRIAATACGLRAMGAEVEEFADGLRVSGPVQLHGAQIDSRGDHRIAMAFSVAALIADSETEIKDAECVAVSFPEFFELLDSVVEK